MIDENDLSRLKEIFVTRQECNLQMEEVTNKLSNDNARLAVIESQLSVILKLLYAIGTGILALLMGSVWNIIAK